MLSRSSGATADFVANNDARLLLSFFVADALIEDALVEDDVIPGTFGDVCESIEVDAFVLDDAFGFFDVLFDEILLDVEGEVAFLRIRPSAWLADLVLMTETADVPKVADCIFAIPFPAQLMQASQNSNSSMQNAQDSDSLMRKFVNADWL